jgi:hypothetical protein
MPKLRIGDSVAKLPIVQGGMGVGISLSGLASAVANEGGIGVIAANAIGMLDPDYYASHKDANAIALRKEIRKAKEMSSGIIGVNIMVAVHDFHVLLRVAIEEKVDMVFLGAGLPLKGIPVEDLRSAGVKVVPIVSSARAARLIFTSWLGKLHPKVRPSFRLKKNFCVPSLVKKPGMLKILLCGYLPVSRGLLLMPKCSQGGVSKKMSVPA